MSFLSKLFGAKNLPNFRDLLDAGAVIIDVRSPQEYDNGHIRGSKNIPLNILKSRAGNIKTWDQAVITVCRSGARSAQAKSILKSQGIEVYNGGGWQKLQSKIS